LPAVIRSEAENERHIAILEKLDRKGNRMSAAEPRMAERLTLLIQDFEEKHYALKSSGPIEALNERMLANELKQKISGTFSEPPRHRLRSIEREAQTERRAHRHAQPSV
jgi:antitoxin component HigA of HigAB toxin-antitoxin module